MNQAIPFISFKGNQFEINPEAEAFLNEMPDSTKLGVISIVGKYRTGKSFFVNRVLLNKSSSDGFSVGPTINPCTKGLWIWKQIVPTNNPDYPDMKAIVIDTEGFGGMDENSNHDTRIFLFSLLLSSYFIYNSVGSIDENALNTISLIVNLAKEIQMKQSNQDANTDVSSFFPSFLWVVRDFALQMVDQNNNSIGSKEYLEKALEQQKVDIYIFIWKGFSDLIESKNRIRRLIKHFFRDRDCNTLVRPVESEQDLQQLDQLADNDLRKEFLEQVKLVKNKIFKKIKPKQVSNTLITGSMFLQLAKTYVKTMNSGSVPNIESAWNYVCLAEGEKALQECMTLIESELSQLQNGNLEIKELSNYKLKLSELAFKKFRTKAIGTDEDQKQYLSKLQSYLEQAFKNLKQQNKENLKKQLQEQLEPKLKEIEQKLKNEQYSNYFDLQGDIFKLRDSFEKDFGRNNENTKDYFDKACLQIFQLAAETLTRKATNDMNKEIQKQLQRMALLEEDSKQKSQEWKSEKSKLTCDIQSLEKEKNSCSINEQNLQEKMVTIQQELKKCEKAKNEIHSQYSSQSQAYQQQFMTLQNQIDRLKNESQNHSNLQDKQLALVTQENEFQKREIRQLNEKCLQLECENKKLRSENVSQKAQNDTLLSRISQLDIGRAQEIQLLQQEFDKKISELMQDNENKKFLQKQQSEWMVEKSYLENQVQFLKNQLEENKRLHDALLIVLQQGINNQPEMESASELVETNRNLSAAMDKLELRCKILEEKSDKLKKFKKMVKNSSGLQCLHCQKTIPQSIFNQHLNQCPGEVMESVQVQSQPISQSNSRHNSMMQISNLDVSSLTITINQTMVKETQDNKPYTEYLLKVQYGNRAWMVQRRYKNFCELHQALLNQFPGLKLPDSSSAIINPNQNDINNILSNKRPTVIEDRRKALQQYLRDLAKIDIIRNSKCFKKFVDIDQENEMKQTNTCSCKVDDF